MTMSQAASKEIVLEVENREVTGSGSCRRMRRQGKIPGNVYGLDRPPFKVAVNPRRIDEVLRLGKGVNTVFQLTLAGENRTRQAMIKELQRDPITGYPMHIDFIRVDPTKKIQVSIPVRLLGIPEGVKNDGGVVDFVNRVVQVECFPAEIPEHFDVDVSALGINQHVSVRELQPVAGVRLVDPPEQIIAVVVAPRAEEVAPTEAAAPAAEAAAAEPEVIRKGKEATEPAAPAPKAGKKKEE
jgi:large subunit ribosomal protein L25